MQIVEMNDGEKIKYSLTDKSIIFGEDDLAINIKNREMDEPILLDICQDKNGHLVIGTVTGQRYVAQIGIPARKYKETTIGTDSDGNDVTERTAEPFDINRCTVYLWALGA